MRCPLNTSKTTLVTRLPLSLSTSTCHRTILYSSSPGAFSLPPASLFLINPATWLMCPLGSHVLSWLLAPSLALSFLPRSISPTFLSTHGPVQLGLFPLICNNLNYTLECQILIFHSVSSWQAPRQVMGLPYTLGSVLGPVLYAGHRHPGVSQEWRAYV